MKRFNQRTIVASLVSISAGAAPAPADHPDTRILHMADVLEAFDFGQERKPELLGGLAIHKVDSMLRGTEAAAVVLVLVQDTVERTYAAVQRSNPLAVGRDIIDAGHLDRDEPDPRWLAALELTPELLGLPSVTINGSAEELETLRAAAATDEAAAIAEYRAVLDQRMRHFLEAGLSRAHPLAREGRPLRIQDKLLRMSAQSPLMRGRAPDVFRALMNFPRDGESDAKHEFGWTHERIADDPVVALSHRVSDGDEFFGFVAERHFYVSSRYITMQLLIGCVPVEEGTALFVHTRFAFEDEAEPFLRMLAKRNDALAAHLVAIRTAVDQDDAPSPKRPDADSDG